MKLLRDPLFHFVVFGVVLFLVYTSTSDLLSDDSTRKIVITRAEIDFLAGGFERQWGRSPSPAELQGLLDARIREEVLYREALALGMDKNDQIVRRRMTQKMDFLTQDLALLADPTEQELRTFYDENQDQYRTPPRLSFNHVYFSTDSRGARAEEDARRLLAELRAMTTTPETAPDRGDQFLLRYEYNLQAPIEIQSDFGSEFAENLFELDAGWQGPVYSAYGVHLVHIGEKVESRIPEFEDLRTRLVGDFNRMRLGLGRPQANSGRGVKNVRGSCSA